MSPRRAHSPCPYTNESSVLPNCWKPELGTTDGVLRSASMLPQERERKVTPGC